MLVHAEHGNRDFVMLRTYKYNIFFVFNWLFSTLRGIKHRNRYFLCLPDFKSSRRARRVGVDDRGRKLAVLKLRLEAFGAYG